MRSLKLVSAGPVPGSPPAYLAAVTRTARRAARPSRDPSPHGRLSTDPGRLGDPGVQLGAPGPRRLPPPPWAPAGGPGTAGPNANRDADVILHKAVPSRPHPRARPAGPAARRPPALASATRPERPGRPDRSVSVVGWVTALARPCSRRTADSEGSPGPAPVCGPPGGPNQGRVGGARNAESETRSKR